MSKEIHDTLFETLDTLSIHSNRLDKLEKDIKSIKSSILDLKSSLEVKIEESIKDALLGILKDITINNDIKPINEVNVDLTQLTDTLDRLANTTVKPITVNPPTVKVELDTSSFKPVDTSNILAAISKQITESTKESRVLLKELINSKEVVVESEPEDIESPVKSINIIRGQDNLIQSLEIIRE